jgi:hypothetical protein
VRCGWHDQRRYLVAVGDLNGNIHRDGAWLGIKQQRKAHHAEQNQHRSADETMPCAPSHDFDALALCRT